MPDEPRIYDVTGKIVDREGAPAVDVLVRASGPGRGHQEIPLGEASTDADGRYRIKVAENPDDPSTHVATVIIQVLAIGPSIALPAFNAGKVKILGVGSAQPVPQLPGVPTVAESVPGFEMSVSFSIFARAGTPPEVISKINADVQQILREPEFQKQFLEPQVLAPMLGSPEQLMRLLVADSEKWGKLIRDANLTVD